MDSFALAVRHAVGDHLGHQVETGRLRLLLDAMAQASNLSTIQSRGGAEIYATGMRSNFDVTDPLHWEDVEEHIDLQSFVNSSGDNQVKECSIEQVPQLELRIGNRIARFEDATRTMCAALNNGRALFYYIFENFIPADGPHQILVEVIVVLQYELKPEVVRDRNLSMTNMERHEFFDALHPSRFSNNDVVGSVTFDHLALLPRFDDSDDDDNDDEAQAEGGNLDDDASMEQASNEGEANESEDGEANI